MNAQSIRTKVFAGELTNRDCPGNNDSTRAAVGVNLPQAGLVWLFDQLSGTATELLSGNSDLNHTSSGNYV